MLKQQEMTEQLANILVIEDNKQVLEGIENILEYGGYQPEGVTTFNEHVYHKIKAKDFGLIILDVMLSGADGRELAKKLKNSEETKDVPILMISAYRDIESSVREAGADDFLPKPFGIKDLMHKVEHFINNGTA